MSRHETRGTWYDEDKVDQTALALLWITRESSSAQETADAGKMLPREVLDRLIRRGLLLSSPNIRSVRLTDEGQRQSQLLFHKMFGSPRQAHLPQTHAGQEVEEDNGE